MIPSVDQLLSIAGRGGPSRASNAGAVRAALVADRSNAGLGKPHRLAHFLAQILHESGGWRFDREVWGPSLAQSRYEGRADLGNTEPGDGKLFRGRTAIQLTGRANYRAFTDWCRQWHRSAPDFVANPDAILTDPWEGLAPVWYWDTRGLNRYADQNDIEMVTRRVNGGLNGFHDRVRYYTRAALVLNGYGPEDVQGFQKDAGLAIDGIPGPRTRDALHKALAGQPERHDARPLPSWWARVLDLFRRTKGLFS